MDVSDSEVKALHTKVELGWMVNHSRYIFFDIAYKLIMTGILVNAVIIVVGLFTHAATYCGAIIIVLAVLELGVSCSTRLVYHHAYACRYRALLDDIEQETPTRENYNKWRQELWAIHEVRK